ncbi:related to nuclear receptor co-repressor/HDAC3 complex subunit TBLR1 [Phialocephala subalpina]|uniref:Related to nuclear receptor co-repressor/HDAC3 complex subunit TBLR1 n=1 Tax=Phialocephala subalpina TaxID=576137 RepID=A0A1L7WJL8_9HELO|nr:related to nuclear receptor co-repressor/HDAC3 complex subunit TBLR1 [Phialocephala subalpina]
MPSSLPPPADEENEIARKRPIDNEQPQNQSAHPGKKPRLSNGYENGFDTTTMDVDDDQNGDENAYPSPEQLPSPVVATNGPSTDTQVAEVKDLTDRVYLPLSDDPMSSNAVLLQCEFNPQDPMILAAAGTDALARMWILTGSDSPENAPHHQLLDENVPSSTTITGLSWSSDGLCLAVSSEPIEDGTAKLEFWSVDGSPLTAFNGFDSPVICLRWNFTNEACLALCPQDEGKGTLLTVMYPRTGAALRFSLPHHILHDQALDATWTSNEEFCICGGDVLQSFLCNENEGAIVAGRKFETRSDHGLSKITYDFHSGFLATASDSGTIDIWDQSGQYRSFNAHQGTVTSLCWQPLKAPRAPGDEEERLLASAGDDGAISIWNARSSDARSKCSMTMNSAVVALSFAPDGEFIAGGTNSHVLIWKVGDVHLPFASWTRGPDPGWSTPHSHDSVVEEDQFSLSWDAGGQRFAYGANSRLAVVTFRP